MRDLKIFRQKGMVTLLVSLILLFGMSLIALFSTKSIVLEKKISANIYRSEQAILRADGALNYMAILLDSSYSNSKLIHDAQQLDTVSVTKFEQQLDAYAQLTHLEVKTAYDNVQVQAYSDDKSSINVLNELVAAVPIAGNGEGKIVTYPVISRLGLDLSKNMRISNPYSTHTIWSGAQVKLGQGSKTFIAKSTIDKQANGLLPVSGEYKSNGIDIYEQDFTLQHMSKSQFFENFLNESADFIKRLAVNNQHYFTALNAQNMKTKNGLIWVGDGNQAITFNNLQIGELNKPVFLIVDATNQLLTTTGEVSIYGLLYIRGDWHPKGNITINGAVIVEGKIHATGDLNLIKTTIIYQPQSLKPITPLAATTAQVIGSWSDY